MHTYIYTHINIHISIHTHIYMACLEAEFEMLQACCTQTEGIRLVYDAFLGGRISFILEISSGHKSMFWLYKSERRVV